MNPRRYSLALAAIALCVAACSHDDSTATVAPARPSTPPPSAPAAAPTSPTSSGGSGSASADPWSTPKTARDPLHRVMMWSATKDGKTLYFLGTMHLGVDAETRLPDVVWKQLDAAPAFAMETDLSGSAAAAMQQDAMRTSGTLHEELGSAYWSKLETALSPPIAHQLDGMKPFVSVEFLSMKGLPPTPPMDTVLRGRAELQHKQLVFLEDASVQTRVIEKWLDRKALIELLDDLDDTVHRQQEMLAAYIAGNDTQLLALNDAERDSALAHGYTAAEYDGELKEILFDRNASWVAPLEKLHAAGGGFVAVGALHLLGPKSVLALLQKDGFVIKRIEP